METRSKRKIPDQKPGSANDDIRRKKSRRSPPSAMPANQDPAAVMEAASDAMPVDSVLVAMSEKTEYTH